MTSTNRPWVTKFSQAVDAQRVGQSIGALTIADVLNTVAELAEAKIALAKLEFAWDRSTYALIAALNRLGS